MDNTTVKMGGYNRTYSPVNFSKVHSPAIHYPATIHSPAATEVECSFSGNSFTSSCSLSGSCRSLNSYFGSAKVAEVVMFKVAEAPENRYDYTLPILSL